MPYLKLTDLTLLCTNVMMWLKSAMTNLPALMNGTLPVEKKVNVVESIRHLVITRGRHELGVGPHLDGELQVAHVKKGLDGKAVGVVRQ